MSVVVRGKHNGEETEFFIEDGIITSIGPVSRTALTGKRLIDAAGTVLAGYTDVHVHGGGGAEVMQGTTEAFEQICKTHAEHGTTGLLLTTVTDSDEAIERAVSAYRPDLPLFGAEILGFHLEGPFICKSKAGAQDPEHIQLPSVEKLKRWMEASHQSVRYMTLAPDVPGALEVVACARDLGIQVAAGHSNATYEQAVEGFACGIRSVTHLYNAMSALNHRQPGLVGAALTSPEVYAELIADCLHVHPAAMKLAFEAKGRERMLLITDAVMAACMPEGSEYHVSRQKVTVTNGAVRLADGTLAGSTLTLDKAVQNLLREGIITDEDVPYITSLNQARLLGLPHGRLEVGAPANLIAVDEQWNVTHTVVRGELVYRR